MGTDEGGGDGFDGAGEKDPAGKSNLRVSYDSMNCIRFDGYNLRTAAIAEHPNRNEEVLMSYDKKSNLFCLIPGSILKKNGTPFIMLKSDH